MKPNKPPAAPPPVQKAPTPAAKAPAKGKEDPNVPPDAKILVPKIHKLMLFPTSGRIGFDRVVWPASEGPYPLSRDAAAKLLMREREVRLSAETQALYDDPQGTDVADFVQRRVLREAGFEATDRDLLVLRSALAVFSDVRLRPRHTLSLLPMFVEGVPGWRW